MQFGTGSNLALNETYGMNGNEHLKKTYITTGKITIPYCCIYVHIFTNSCICKHTGLNIIRKFSFTPKSYKDEIIRSHITPCNHLLFSNINTPKRQSSYFENIYFLDKTETYNIYEYDYIILFVIFL